MEARYTKVPSCTILVTLPSKLVKSRNWLTKSPLVIECAHDWSGQMLASMRSILLFLNTQSWQCQEAEDSSGDDDQLSEVKAPCWVSSICFRPPFKLKVSTLFHVWIKLKTLLSILGLTCKLDVTATRKYGTYLLGIQQYGQKPYCILLFAIYCYVAIFGIILAKRGSVYSAQSASYEVQNSGSLGDLGAWPQEISLDCAGNFS